MNHSAGFSVWPKKNQCHQASAKRASARARCSPVGMQSSTASFVTFSMVECQAVRDGGAAVMDDDAEALMSEEAHQFDHVGGHRPLRRL